MADVVRYELDGNVAVITVDNPPVNALSQAVRQGLVGAVARLNADAGAAAGLLLCAGRTFIAGADIAEFGRPPLDPPLPEVVDRIEASEKLIVAAIHGTALGGGFEVAMACHYRCALVTARVGLPEVNLGLLPGATGTQRLPRLIGVKRALDLILGGKPVSAGQAYEDGALDKLYEKDLEAHALHYARVLTDERAHPRRLSGLAVDTRDLDRDFFKTRLAEVENKYRGWLAPQSIVRCVEASVRLPYAEAVRLERKLFNECRASPQSRAMRHLFFAEREAARIPGVPRDTPAREIGRAAVIGGGTMGSGIAVSLLNAGRQVHLLERNSEALEQGMASINRHFASAVAKGRLTGAERAGRLERLSGSTDYADIRESDIAIEAVYEDLDAKREIFRRLDGVLKAGAVLASNTSTLDLNAIAAATRRPADVVGLHFFAPAQVMDLVEIVRGANTSVEVMATAMRLTKDLGKTGVAVGVCFGFVGNRMFLPYVREAQRLVLEGVPPSRVDGIAREWGMAMGPLEVMDLSGLDVFHHIYEATPGGPGTDGMLVAALGEQGRLGQKTGAGFYRYDGREPLEDPRLTRLAAELAGQAGIERGDPGDEQIIERLIYPMINEGARILAEGVASRPGDIDVIMVHGYGMARYRGGPMCYADSVGLEQVCRVLGRHANRYGADLGPAPLLERLAAQGRELSSSSGGGATG